MFKKMKSVITLFLGLVALPASHAQAASASGAEEIMALRKSEPAKLLVLDVRTSGEFAGGRIPGAVLIPMAEIPSRLGSIPRDKKIVVVCASGARSAAVTDYLDKNGYPWVRNYTGGMIDWRRRGLPVEK